MPLERAYFARFAVISTTTEPTSSIGQIFEALDRRGGRKKENVHSVSTDIRNNLDKIT